MKEDEIRALLTLAFVLLITRLNKLIDAPRTVMQYSEKQGSGKQSG